MPHLGGGAGGLFLIKPLTGAYMSQGFLSNLDANLIRKVLIKREGKTAYGSYRCFYYHAGRKEKRRGQRPAKNLLNRPACWRKDIRLMLFDNSQERRPDNLNTLLRA
jgi:hypothetical protein